uniref:HDC07437 n=1 Tax=Drosophila melanogaster TaxID=7227 RepID=Q6IM62_DROME|nr:TPA_inf: HDC07437 [Drosophila melanogaster]
MAGGPFALLLATFVSFAMHRLILTLNLKCFMQQHREDSVATHAGAPSHMGDMEMWVPGTEKLGNWVFLGSGILQGHRVLAVVWSSASVAPACNYLFTALSSSPRAMSFVLHLVPCNKLSYQVSLIISAAIKESESQTPRPKDENVLQQQVLHMKIIRFINSPLATD